MAYEPVDTLAQERSGGPLHGVRVVEVGGIGPGPFTGMLLSDLGAEVIRIDRPSGRAALFVHNESNLMLRGRRSVVLDLHRPECLDVAIKLISTADALIEGFRPGVMERLGLGPEACTLVNPRLVYGRVTGWGQTGPLSGSAGHDINYIAMSGILGAMGRPGEPPTLPLNLIGDFAGGGLLLAFGIVSALLERVSSGKGQIVDAAMLEGSALLTTAIHSLRGAGQWSNERHSNVVDGGAPFYNVYATADQRFVAVGAVEPQFFRALVIGLGLDTAQLPDQMDRSGWPAMRELFERQFGSKTRSEWVEAFAGKDACVSPVLTFDEVEADPHNQFRQVFHKSDEFTQPSPAPKFNRTPAKKPGRPPNLGVDTKAVLEELGLSPNEISRVVGENGLTPA